jgi:hypothetical protein
VIGVALLGQWAGTASAAPSTQAAGSGIQLTAEVDHIGVNPSGDRTPTYLMAFSHAAQVSGDYSVTVTGGPITSGQAVAGFLLGCGISVAGGVTAGIAPNEGLNAGVSPSVTLNTPPSVSIAPSVGGSLGASETMATTLEPGQVTSATTATAVLNDKTQYPFHLTVGNAALNIAQCASPVGAVPFVTTSVSTPHGMVQTTAYGDQFTF